MPEANGTRGDEPEDVELSPDEYTWLQEQLSAAARIAGGEDTGEADEEDWEDPTGGPLTELLSACEDGQTQRVQDLLPNFPGDINTPGPDGDTALHLACLYGHLDCVQALLSGGANANIVNPEDSSTALHDAAAGGYKEICEMLLAKANTTILQRADADGDTPLHNAARGNHLDVVKLLLDCGADPNVQNGYGNKPVDEAEEEAVIELLRVA